ncbi:hypothetical protein ACFSHQ_18200 [Gemmobacter lanyuensis]
MDDGRELVGAGFGFGQVMAECGFVGLELRDEALEAADFVPLTLLFGLHVGDQARMLVRCCGVFALHHAAPVAISPASAA